MIDLTGLKIGKTYLLTDRNGQYFKGTLKRQTYGFSYIFDGGYIGRESDQNVKVVALSTANAMGWKLKGEVSQRSYGA